MKAAAGVLEAGVRHLDNLDAGGAHLLDCSPGLCGHHHAAGFQDLEVADVVVDVLVEVGLHEQVTVALEPQQAPRVDCRA